jgi:hypothetical protein
MAIVTFFFFFLEIQQFSSNSLATEKTSCCWGEVFSYYFRPFPRADPKGKLFIRLFWLVSFLTCLLIIRAAVFVVVQRLELCREEWASELSPHSWVFCKYPVSQFWLIVVRIAASQTIR